MENAFNRTAYGIEITQFRKAQIQCTAFNRTAYGIEIYEVPAFLFHKAIAFNRTAYGIEINIALD